MLGGTLPNLLFIHHLLDGAPTLMIMTRCPLLLLEFIDIFIVANRPLYLFLAPCFLTCTI
jgi:hypothetical protein